MRRLVTVQKIGSISPIEGADAIEVAKIGGWDVVIRKGEFSVGDEVFYFEIDSMLPLDNPDFSFLEPRGVKEQDGRKYHRLKTAKLRGQVSQGLILDKSIFKGTDYEWDSILDAGGDFSEYFEVIKYDPPEKFDSTGTKMYDFPAWITKTDEDRIQSLDKDIVDEILANRNDFIPTEKIDGTSCTIWCKINEVGEYEYGVCTRNHSLEENDDNAYWKIAKTPCINYLEETYSSLEYLKLKCLESARAQTWGSNTPSYVLQGELFGESIQKNPLGIKGRNVRFFNFIKNGTPLTFTEIEQDYPELMLVWVPVHDYKLPDNIEDIIKQPDGVKTRVFGANRQAQIEGFVWRHRSKAYLKSKIDVDKIPEDKRELVLEKLKPIRASFKSISNKYLLKHEGE